VPYLDLASNGSDPNERAARGYIQAATSGNRSSTVKRSSDSPSGNGWAQSPG